MTTARRACRAFALQDMGICHLLCPKNDFVGGCRRHQVLGTSKKRSLHQLPQRLGTSFCCGQRNCLLLSLLLVTVMGISPFALKLQCFQFCTPFVIIFLVYFQILENPVVSLDTRQINTFYILLILHSFGTTLGVRFDFTQIRSLSILVSNSLTLSRLD